MRHPEYPEYELILSTKLKNAINKIYGGNYFEFDLHNISINGEKRGCSGFVRNMWNNTVVYVSTEPIYCGFLRRYAKDMKDYGGCHSVNRFSKDLKSLAYDVIIMLGRSVTFNPLPSYDPVKHTKTF